MPQGTASFRFDDAARLRALRDYRVLDTPPEEVFDGITQLATQIFQAPIALVTLVDEARQWFKSRVGLETAETPRDVAFCDHAIRAAEPMIVTDAALDPKFRDNPLVTGDPGVRFYCGVPLRSPEGHGLGTLCIIDRQPRVMTERQLKVLKVLARHAELELETRRRILLLEEVTETLRRTQHDKELMAAMVVHDLRSPLTGISLIASLLAGKHPEAGEDLEELLDEAERMRGMLSNVLDICLAETKAFRLRRIEFSLSTLAARVARRMKRPAMRRSQSIQIDVPSSPLLVDADPELLERVIINLLENAIKHAPAGEVVELSARSSDDGRIRVEVRDRGETISGPRSEEIFRPFETTELSRGPSAGYGLGLAFCKLVIEAHAGLIGASPNPPYGDTFFFELPASPAF